MIQFTKFTHPEPCGKVYEISQQTGEFTSLTIGNIKSARIETISMKSIAELPIHLSLMNNYNHITSGVSSINAHTCLMGPVNYDQGVINRSNKDLPFPDCACLFVLDSDGVTDFPVFEAIKLYAHVQYSSSGSLIYDTDGTEHRGFNGSHTVFAVKEGKYIKKAMERLHKREIIAYRGLCKVSEAGTFLERSSVDQMLSSPSQPIYFKPTLTNGLIQNKKINFVEGILEPIDLKNVIKPLTKDEKELYLVAVDYYKKQFESEMRRVRDKWINARMLEGVSEEHAKKALEDKALEYDFVIHTKQGSFTVAQILEDPLRFNKITCKDPFEPEYGSNTVAKIYSFQNRPMINSNAHGGVTYTLHDAHKAFSTGGGLPTTIDNETGEVAEVKQETLPGNATYLMTACIDQLHWTPSQVTSKMDALTTVHNFKLMLGYYGINVAYDLIAKDIILSGPEMIGGDDDLKDAANLGWMNHLCELNKIKTSKIPHYLNVMMQANQVNPVAEWIEEEAWDGQDRITELFETLTLADDQNKEIAAMTFRKWLMGACRIVKGEIDSFEYVLVLQAEDGGEGKTRWFNRLCPGTWQTDGMIFDPSDKDSVKQAISYWLVELGELDSTFKSDIKKTMAFLTKSRDEIRLPYAAKSAKFQRRTAFFGSVNKKNFLIDDSGDRRFWPISVTHINYQYEIDMQQLWAQVDNIPMSEKHYLDRTENFEVIEANKDFKSLDFVEDVLSSYFSREVVQKNKIDFHGNVIGWEPASMVHLNVTEVLNKAGVERPTQTNLNKASVWLKDKGFKPHRTTEKRGFWVTNIRETNF